ncbi:GNAT family N-acetyltransferase, partial [Acidiphilium sp.]|uniref:GNAT family N-acetyltransferase n=1 Tax=Acidiphilium sp. TaxID=527 RepID=UPI003D055AF7
GVSGGDLAGIGGITRDPIAPRAFRMRRFYVRPLFRRTGVGRALVTQLMAAVPHGAIVTVHAGDAAASAFWVALGFAPEARDGHTHVLPHGVLPRGGGSTALPTPPPDAR